MASIIYLPLLLFVFELVSLNALSQTHTNRTEWEINVGDWANVGESWPINRDAIDTPIRLPSGSSFSLKMGTTLCIGQSANNYMNLIMMYGANNQPVILCEPSLIELKFTTSKPIFSFGLKMEPTNLGNYEMSIVLNDGTTLTQIVASGEEMPLPTFFGFIAGDKNDFISSIKLISNDITANKTWYYFAIIR